MTRKKINFITFTFWMLALTIPDLRAQVENHGEIYLEEGAELHIEGNYEHHAGGSIFNQGSIFLKGDCSNHTEASIFRDQKGKMILTGSLQQMKGNDPYLGELWLEEDQNLILNSYLTVEDFLQLNDGTIDLNGQSLIFQNSQASSLQWDDGKLLSQESPSRVIWSHPSEHTAYTLPFGSMDNESLTLSFELLSTNASSVVVNSYAVDDENKPLPDGVPEMTVQGYDISNKTVDRFWYIDPEGEELKLELSISDADLEGNDIPPGINLMLLYYDGDHWTSTSSLESAGDKHFVTTVDKAGWYALGLLLLPINRNPGHDLSFFPLPFSEYLQVLLPEKIQGKIAIYLYDFQSKKVFEEVLYISEPQIQINTDKLLPGSYLIVIEDSQNKSVYRQKLIKQ